MRQFAEVARVRQRAALVSSMCALWRLAERSMPSARRCMSARVLLRWHLARLRLTPVFIGRHKQSLCNRV